MRLPRDLSGSDLARSLRTLGYEITRQTGSHIRPPTEWQGQHHVTIPNHSSLKLSTLSGIPVNVAEYFGTSRDELAKQLFGQ